ncbi:MAG: putative repeat protein (TIGR01451 family), partial [Crocinitomix sp.]
MPQLHNKQQVMRKTLLLLSLLVSTFFYTVSAYSQTVTPFSLRYSTSAKGSIDFVSNAILQCDGTGGGGANCADLDAQLPPTFASWSQNNDHVAEFIDIDGDPSTFSSSSDSLDLGGCSTIAFAGIYWGGRADDDDLEFLNRGDIRIDANGDGYTDVSADLVIDAGAAEGLGNRVYYCFADITDLIASNPIQSLYTVADVYSRLGGGANRWGGWNIVVVYENDLLPMRNLNVFDGLVNVNNSGTEVEVGISGFLTPPSGPVTFEVGVYGYDGDRGFVGDSLLFDGGSGYVAISDALNPANDIFNFSQSTAGVVSNSQEPLRHNNISIDADIFEPDNAAFAYIGNSASSADVKVTTSNETVQVQVITLAIDVYEPDVRAGVRVEDLNGGLLEPGDTLKYTVVGSNVGSDPSIDTYLTDTLANNIEYVPETIEITFGPNSGTKTDAIGDDQAFYDATGHFIRVNIGDLADDAIGGEVENSPSGADSTVFTFCAVAIDDCVHLTCDNIVENQAYIFGTGEVSGNDFSNESNPGIFDADGCPLDGTTSVVIDITDCVLPNDTTVASFCDGVDFADFPYDEFGYDYFDDVFAPVTEADGAGTYYAIREAYVGCADTVEITITDYFDEPTASNAGPDQTACLSPGTATLAGNNPGVGTGLWTVTVGGATVTTPTAFNSGVTGLTIGTNTFVWTITNGVDCPPSVDEITIVVTDVPTTSNAGPNQTLCVDPGTATLAGNNPVDGTGAWTVTAGGSTVTTPTAFNSGVTGLTVGVNTFRWTISNAPCADSFDEITITVSASPSTSSAGADQSICEDPGTATLAGNNPVDGTGLWTVISGGGSVTTPAAFNSGVTGLTVGANTFRWTISNAPCADSFDEITITVDAAPTTANAGADQELCLTTTATLEGNDPAVGTGTWTVITGGGSITDPGDFDTEVTGLTPGVNTFRWTISNGACADSFDEVSITFDPDSDGDGICDAEDIDDDNDGILDTAEGDEDSDGDGIPDRLDLDSDNDGIPDIVEAGGEDTDGDGRVDDDTDTDGDGYADTFDPDDGGTELENPDSDGDGVSDATDLDSDNDGTPDIIEAGGVDTDGDGRVDDPTDTDGDGYADTHDTDDGGTPLDNPDTDGDGVVDVLDLDSDNDGIPDVIENGGTDDNGDGVIDGYTDVDGDGFADEVDTNDDTIPGPDDGGTPLPMGDADMDGIPNYLDLDSDNDGILDIVEAGGEDTDGDGTIDDFADVDGDGFDDTVDTDDNTVPGPDDGGTALDVPNTDGTGGPDYLDIDADGDGIPDNIEGQPSDDYTAATGTDTDGDGIDDAYDIDDGGTPIGDYDHDADGEPDYIDLDSDNDGESDLIEGHDTDGDGTPDTVPSGTDSDGDGLDDAFDTVVLDPGTTFTNAGNGTVDPLTDDVLADADAPDVGDLDFRENDSDGDGIDDSVDLDDDNDGIPDLEEGDGDTDGDGIPDSLDLDSDNDGIPDIIEAGGTDTDGDGVLDDFVDTDGDGLGDEVDEDDGGTPLDNPDSDGDGVLDIQDLDSDNDGTPDVIEAGGTDDNGDGVIDDFVDADGDGFADEVDTTEGGTPLDNPDTDGDGVPDVLDLDSDNDGIPDIIENGGTDDDGDGVIDGYTDVDGDGFADEVDTDDNTIPGPDDGGTPLPMGDADMDGIPNYLDLDSDNDGILDITEAGGTDTDGDGTIDDFTDVDGDGYADTVDTDDNTVPGTGDGGTALDVPNTDGTGGPDYLDIDADGDGIPDNVEGQPSDDYTAATGTDTDGDGIDDAYDIDDGGTPIGDYDHDADGEPDYIDLDSD